MTKHFAVIFCLITFAVSIAAQDSRTGIPAFGSLDQTALDSINRQNLNTHISIPIVSLPGRGFPFQISLNYDSLMWKKSGTFWTPVVDQNGSPTWGWGRILAPGTTTYSKSRITCIDPETGWRITVNRYYGYVYIDPDGKVHSFDVSYDGCMDTDNTTGYSTDGAGYRIQISGGGFSAVTSPSGISSTVTQRTDTNGNFVSAGTPVGGVTTWTDTRNHAVVKVNNSVIGTTKFLVIDQDGGNSTEYTLTYTQYNIKTNFDCGVGEYTSSSAVWLPTTLTLPNGRSYSFAYETTPGYPTYKTGRLSSMTLPTGGTVTYTYPGSNGGINCSDGSYNSLSRAITADGATSTWNFTRVPSGTDSVTTVEYPEMPYDTVAKKEVFTFSGTHEIERKTYQGSTGGTPLQTVTSNWANLYPTDQKITLPDGLHKTTHTDWTVNGPTQISEYDWTSEPGNGTLLRTTVLTYVTDTAYANKNLLNLVSSKKIYDGNTTGTLRSSTDYIYDEAGAVTSCPTDVPQHNDSYGCTSPMPRGIVTTIKAYADLAGNNSNSPVITQFTYDSFGNVLTTKVNNALQSTATYSATTQYSAPDSMKLGSAPTLTTSYTYNSYTGLTASQTDPNNGGTVIQYDAMFRPTVITRADNKTITYSYDDLARIVTVTSPLDDSRTLTQTSWADQLGRTYKTQTPTGTTETQFDPLGRTYKVSNPYANGGSAGYWTETRYDALGRVLSVIAPDSVAATASYSANTVTVTDGAGKQRKNVFDGLGRLTTVYEPDVDNGNSLTVPTSYTYTALGFLSQATQGVQTRTFTYDGLNRIKSAQTPEAGTVIYSYAGCTSPSDVCSRTDARGVITNYTYDTLNRPYQVSYNVGTTGVPLTPAVTYTYGTSTTDHNNGRLITLADGTHTDTYTYDLLGNVLSVAKMLAAKTYTTQYAYNDAGLVTRLTYPSGMYLDHAYDDAGRMLSVTDNDGKQLAKNLGYNPAGQVTGYAMGLTGGDVTAAIGYSDKRLQLSTLQYSSPTKTLLSLTYGYAQNDGNNGQITSIDDLVDGGRSADYMYDALGRLTSFTTTGSTSYAKQTMSWTYDRYGNRLTQVRNDTTQTLNPSPSTNRLNGYSYDSNGNLTNVAPYVLKWDAENRLVDYAAGSVTFEYDASSLRVRRTKQGGSDVVYVFSGAQPLAEYAAGAEANSPSKEYIYLGGQLLASKDSAGTYTFFERDHLSIRGILAEANPNSPTDQGHLPFGESWYGTGNKWNFTSYERDADVGDDFAVFRRYQYANGRFSSPDPVLGSLDNPQSWNRYSYVWNDAVNAFDPLGLNRRALPEGEFPGGGGGFGFGNCNLDGFVIDCNLAAGPTGDWVSTCPNNDCIDHDYNSPGFMKPYIFGADNRLYGWLPVQGNRESEGYTNDGHTEMSYWATVAHTWGVVGYVRGNPYLWPYKSSLQAFSLIYDSPPSSSKISAVHPPTRDQVSAMCVVASFYENNGEGYRTPISTPSGSDSVAYGTRLERDTTQGTRWFNPNAQSGVAVINVWGLPEIFRERSYQVCMDQYGH